MRILICFLCILVSVTDGVGQTKLVGQVTDVDGRPLPLANLSIEGSYDGSSTDMEGVFEFTTAESGRKILLASYTGFETHRDEIELNGQTMSFSIQLKENVRSLDAVTISAGSFTAGDHSARKIFRAVDIATTAGATADIAGALNTLPGTQKAGESGRLFIRGGHASETLTFIDGLLVTDAYGPAAPNAPSRGRFLPFMFKGISFSTGGYSAEYGQALSSALVLESKDKSEITRTDFGILSVGGDIAHTQVWGRGSIAAKIQYTNLQPYFKLIKQNMEWKTPPTSRESHIAYRQQSGKHGLLKIYGNVSDSQLAVLSRDLDDGRIESLSLKNYYRYLNSSYKNPLSDAWMLRGGLSYSNTRTITFRDSSKNQKDHTALHAKIVLEGSASDIVEVKAGLEIIDQYHLFQNNNGSSRVGQTLAASFLESDVFISRQFISRAGLRLEHNSINHQVSVDPRFSLAYRTGLKSQVSFAYGKFRQSQKEEFRMANPGLRPEKAVHYILNYQRTENEKTFRIETYYKKYDDLLKFEEGKERHAGNSGFGFARGFEVFWRDNRSIKNSDYWMSYSFLDTKRYYLDFPVEAVPTFASKHNFSVVFKYFITRWKSQVGGTYAYTSGRRFEDPNNSTFNDGTTPSYQDLSLNWSYLPTPSLIVYFSCTNLLGRDNIFGYEYGTLPNQSGIYPSRPIRQPAKNFLFAAIFITLSKQRSVNQLPNL